MSIPERNRADNAGNGLDHIQHIPEAPFLSGLKQRLLSFIFQGIWNEEDDPALVRHAPLRKWKSLFLFI